MPHWAIQRTFTRFAPAPAGEYIASFGVSAVLPASCKSADDVFSCEPPSDPYPSPPAATRLCLDEAAVSASFTLPPSGTRDVTIEID